MTTPEDIELATSVLGERPLDPDDAVRKLVDYQRRNHPDLFVADIDKAAATENFKRAGDVLDRVRRSLLTGDASALALVKPEGTEIARATISQLELSVAMDKHVRLLAELESARTDNTLLQHKAEQLEKQLRDRRNTDLQVANERVAQRYKPTTRSIALTGATVALTLLLALLGQVEQVAMKILAPLGLTAASVALVMSTVLLFTVVMFIRNQVRSLRMNQLAEELCSTTTLKGFQRHLSTHSEECVEFTESEVVAFIVGHLRAKSMIEKATVAIGFQVLSKADSELLKDLMIAHMVKHGLVEIGPTHNLERLFRLKQRPRYVSWTDPFEIP